MVHPIRTISWTFKEVAAEQLGLPKALSFTLSAPEDVFTTFRSVFDNHVRERFATIWLSSSHAIMGYEVVSEGTLNSSLVHPREVFRGAIVASCASILLAHNHPSGNPEPSQEDIQVTRQIVDSGKLLGIPVTDHIIFAGDSFTSFAERSILG